MSYDTVPFQRAKLAKCDLADGDRCIACQHGCTIKEGHYGICGVRMNVDGHLRCLKNRISYARLDPIERKPIFHFMPGSKVYSIGTVGCNFRCDFCQNHAISIDFHDYPMTYAPPAMVVRQAIRDGADGVAFTFNEPAVSLEYYRDISTVARRKGLYSVFVTNGYLSREAIDYIDPHIDAYIIGVKMFEEGFYRRACGASLEKLKKSIRMIAEVANHLELSYLVMNGDGAFGSFLSFLDSLPGRYPLHLGKFFPEFRSKEGETMTEKLLECYGMAEEAGLDHVYISDLYGSEYENTYCPRCKSMVIGRSGMTGEGSISMHCSVYDMVRNSLTTDGRCPKCGQDMAVAVPRPKRRD